MNAFATTVTRTCHPGWSTWRRSAAAVRDTATTDHFLAALAPVLAERAAAAEP